MHDTAFASSRPRIRVAGEARRDLQDALSAMIVNLPLTGCAHAELQLANFGQGEGQAPGLSFEDLRLGDEVELAIDTDGEGRIFQGEITALEERYGDGAPRLVLLLQDPLHRLGRRRRSRVFEDTTLDAVVRSVADDAGLEVEVSASTVATDYHQLNESDLAFLLRLLAPLDIALRLEDGRLRVRPEEPDATPVRVDPQDNALQVRLIADLNHQHDATEVRGFNAATDQAAVASASTLATPPPGTTAAQLLGRLGWPGPEVVVQPFARSQGEADAFVAGRFRRRAKYFVSGDIRMLGQSALRSGREIELAGVSGRLRGTYQVVHCVHRFDNAAGYETELRVHRPDWND
ncbi:phage late control D family protein [Thioalkalivibrio paradoxus]|uniref:Phage protein D n=1 Tax=Thioalkalivibrio paradoxus ARh 1 TaxID=713585 RepID=W0DFK8_9GAMM|nr:contractile injection system protein, VgrG/Pvc8 family [Thioalkalivibrio paradoxus]AHE97429.1 hypothetical protein THITH_03115 [Thioalkalivibrio paradoxus ARh 1]